MNLTTILILCNLLTLILAILTIIHTFRLVRLRSIKWMIALSLIFLIGSFCHINVYIAQDFDQKVLFLHLRILGMAFLPPCILYFFSSVFDIWGWLHKKWVIILIFAPSVLNIILLCHPSTRFLLLNNFRPITLLGVSSVKFDFGVWYVPLYYWAMVLLMSSYVMSFMAFMKSDGFRRRQVLILNTGMTISIVQSVIARIFPSVLEIEFIFLGTFILLGTAIGIMYAVIYHRLLSIVPLAMERIFKQFPDPVFVLDDQDRVMRVNDRGIKFFGLGPNYLGQYFDKFIPSVALKPGEVILEDQQRNLHHFHLGQEKIGKENEAASGSVVYFKDVSTQKNIELHLQEEMEFRTHLLALLAHDLSGFVDTQATIVHTMQRNDGSDYSKNLDHLESLSLASQNLINNVMNWIQSESIKFDNVKKSFEWNTLIIDVLEQIQGRLRMKEIEIVFDHPSVPVLTTGDSEMMASVFRNILFNSIRASVPKSKIYVTLSHSGQIVEVKIRDEGQGIEQEELRRILEATKVFSPSGVSKTHGSGIGLMLARSFLSLHKGSFSMESQLGVGTEIVFSIPK